MSRWQDNTFRMRLFHAVRTSTWSLEGKCPCEKRPGGPPMSSLGGELIA